MKKRNEKTIQVNEELNELFIQDKGIWGRFFKMLWKSKLPILWIAGFIAIDLLIVKLGVRVTEYLSEMFAGNLATGIIFTFLGLTIVNILISAVSFFARYAVQGRIDRNLRRMVWDKITRLPLSYFDQNKPRELLTRITNDTSAISHLIVLVIIPFFTNIYTLFLLFQKVLLTTKVLCGRFSSSFRSSLQTDTLWDNLDSVSTTSLIRKRQKWHVMFPKK